MLLSGQTSTIFKRNGGSFSAADFGANAAILQWYAVNIGNSSVFLFNGQYTLASGQQSPVFAMSTGFKDTGTYFFNFESKGGGGIDDNGLLIVASIANEQPC